MIPIRRHPRFPHHHCHRDLSGVPLRWVRRVHFYNSQRVQRGPQPLPRPLSCSVSHFTPLFPSPSPPIQTDISLRLFPRRLQMETNKFHVENTCNMDIKGSCWREVINTADSWYAAALHDKTQVLHNQTRNRRCVELRTVRYARNTASESLHITSVTGRKYGIINYYISSVFIYIFVQLLQTCILHLKETCIFRKEAGGVCIWFELFEICHRIQCICHFYR